LDKKVSGGSKVENWLGTTKEEDVKVEDGRRSSHGVPVKKFSISERLGRGEVSYFYFLS
jgi:hypothetical protein